MISGPEIIEDIVNEMRRRLQADCYLPPHMVHHNFSLYGCLEVTVTLTSDDRPSVVTECWIRMGSANNGRGTEAAYPEPLPATRVALPEARRPVPVPSAADMPSVDRLRALISGRPGCCQNQLFQLSGMGRTECFGF